MTEAELIEITSVLLEDQGYLAITSVRVPPREIDLVLIDRASLAVVAVEAKLRDWRKAVEQAAVNLWLTDYSLIVMPMSSISRIDLSILQNTDIGIVGYESPRKLVTVKCANKSRVTIRAFKQQIYREVARRIGSWSG